MVEVIIDRQKNRFIPSSGASIDRVVSEMRSYIASQGRVIINVLLDGATLSGELLRDLVGRDAKEFGMLEVQTADPVELSISIIDELKPMLSTLEKQHQEASSLIQAGELPKALDLLHVCFIKWSTFFNAIRGISIITKIDPGVYKIDQEPIQQKFERLQNTLVSFQDAFKNRDVLKIGDVIEYELKPLIYDWYIIIDRILAFLKTQHG
jgi:hypothetical protein